MTPLRDTYSGGARGATTLCPHPWEAGGTRIALCAELFPTLLSSEGAFSGIVDSLGKENLIPQFNPPV